VAENVYNVVCTTTFLTKVCSSRNKTCYRWENYSLRYISPVQQYQYKDSFTKLCENIKRSVFWENMWPKRSLNYVCVEVFEKTIALNVKVNSVGHFWDMAESLCTNWPGKKCLDSCISNSGTEPDCKKARRR
jgi:hypothetical protein